MVKVTGFKRAISTSLFIRDHLLAVGEDYPGRVHHQLREELKEHGYHLPSYQNTRNYFNILLKLGLIEFVRTERGDPSDVRLTEKSGGAEISETHNYPWLKERRFYRVIPGRKDDIAWQNPQQAVREM